MPSTLSRRAQAALIEIQHHIALARAFVADAEFDQFRNDLRTIYAVTRCLEIISEASRRLPDDLKRRHAAIPWKQIAGAGNVYRHDYEDVASQIIWDTVRFGLADLAAAIETEVASLGGSTP